MDSWMLFWPFSHQLLSHSSYSWPQTVLPSSLKSLLFFRPRFIARQKYLPLWSLHSSVGSDNNKITNCISSKVNRVLWKKKAWGQKKARKCRRGWIWWSIPVISALPYRVWGQLGLHSEKGKEKKVQERRRENR
jgi:hypothetical protein